MATQQFRAPVILQKFLSEIDQGETRLWFVDGKRVGQVKKLPLKNDFRVNIDQGSRLAKCTLTLREKRIAQSISKYLKQNGIRLAAIDLIGPWVSDFNFTSPGLIPLMETTMGMNLARPILDSLLNNR